MQQANGPVQDTAVLLLVHFCFAMCIYVVDLYKHEPVQLEHRQYDPLQHAVMYSKCNAWAYIPTLLNVLHALEIQTAALL